MNLYSKYLDKELDIEASDIKEGESENAKVAMKVVSHDSLRRIFLSEKSLRLSCEYIPVFMERNHYAVLCKMSDSAGREVQEIGESLPATLTNAIAKNYPILMAYQRAFDRALIAFLGFNGKVLSDMELPTVNPTTIPEIMDDSVLEEYEKKAEDTSENIPEDVEKYEEYSENANIATVIPSEIEDDEPIFEDSEGPAVEAEPEIIKRVENGKWNQKFYGKSIYLDGEKVQLTDEEVATLKEYLTKK